MQRSKTYMVFVKVYNLLLIAKAISYDTFFYHKVVEKHACKDNELNRTFYPKIPFKVNEARNFHRLKYIYTGSDQSG